MDSFNKKVCGICGEKVGILNKRKLKDVNICKKCADLISPFFVTDQRKTTLAEVKEHLTYRELNKTKVATFNVTRTLGDVIKVLIDENTNKFIITSSIRWQSENPDVINFSQVTGCQTYIKKYTAENEGTYYNFHVKIHSNSRWLNKIEFKINKNGKRKNSAEYLECERQINEIKQIFINIQQANAPKSPLTCPVCGAFTTPDANDCCEYCGKPIKIN